MNKNKTAPRFEGGYMGTNITLAVSDGENFKKGEIITVVFTSKTLGPIKILRTEPHLNTYRKLYLIEHLIYQFMLKWNYWHWQYMDKFAEIVWNI